MAQKSIPEEVKKYKPANSSEIRHINGNYYVYITHFITLPGSNLKKKSKKCIGKIIPGTGFIPNKNYDIYYKEEDDNEEFTLLEYGEYALVWNIANEVLVSLKKYFTDEIAHQIFTFVILLYINKFPSIGNLQSYYEISWLIKENKDFSFDMKKASIEKLIEYISVNKEKVTSYESTMVKENLPDYIDDLSSSLFGYEICAYDYIKKGGFPFFMLVINQIHEKLLLSVSKSDYSVDNILIMSHILLMSKTGNVWTLKNARKKELDILKEIGFEPSKNVIE